MVALTLGPLARCAISDGRVEEAVSLLKESLRINRDLGGLWGTVLDLRTFARILAVKGRAAAAARILSGARTRHQEMGFRMDPFIDRFDEETLSTIRMQLDDGALAEALEQGRALNLEEVATFALKSLA